MTSIDSMAAEDRRSEGLVDYVGQDDKGFVVTGEEADRHPDCSRHWEDPGELGDAPGRRQRAVPDRRRNAAHPA